MDYEKVKERLEAEKLELLTKLQNPNLTTEEKERIQHSISNFDYIIELTDMNHYERGVIVQ